MTALCRERAAALLLPGTLTTRSDLPKRARQGGAKVWQAQFKRRVEVKCERKAARNKSAWSR